MNDLLLHERFEIEALTRMKNSKLLEPLVFGGGTMLRLCYDLNRYSRDLDFWIVKPVNVQDYFVKVRDALKNSYELTDTENKQQTLLFELRSGQYPKRLKIEIRKVSPPCDFQERIAFSPGGTEQVILRVHTLEETMKRKIQAALTRKVIRDFFDLEFLLRRGVALIIDAETAQTLAEIVATFKPRDYQVTLGSLLDLPTRQFYVANQFSYLLGKLNAIRNA